MTGPRKRRFIGRMPEVRFFKPAGVPMAALEAVDLSPDELEAMRLVHQEELYQEEAAGRMGISRQTLGRILSAAHRKVTDALTGGMAIRIADSEHVVERRGRGGGRRRRRGRRHSG